MTPLGACWPALTRGPSALSESYWALVSNYFNILKSNNYYIIQILGTNASYLEDMKLAELYEGEAPPDAKKVAHCQY